MRRFLAIVLVSTLFGVSAQAVPSVVPYLGYLTYESGGPVTGSFDVGVAVYSASVGGVVLWGPYEFQNVAVLSGLLSLPLGGESSPDLASALDSGQSLWIEFSIAGTTLAPRQQVLSVPFARRAENANKLGGLAAAQYARLSDLPSAALSGSYLDLADVPDDFITGSGETARVPLFSGARELGTSVISESEGRIGVGVESPAVRLDVSGGVKLGMVAQSCNSSLAGTLRWTGTALEFCDGLQWAPVGSGPPGGGDECADGMKNGSETDVDCGGTCPACGGGKSCLTGSDCAGGLCLATVCEPAHCTNGTLDGGETGVDCGGTCSLGCPIGGGCANSSDCDNAACINNICGFNCGETFEDSRDGRVYDTVQIAGKCWMRENLNVGSFVTVATAQDPTGAITKWCYNNVETNCNVWGGQYVFLNAVRNNQNQITQGICPSGWRIPTKAEWDAVWSTQGVSAFTVSQTTMSLLFSGRYAGQWLYGTMCGTSEYVQVHYWYSDTSGGGFAWAFGNCPSPNTFYTDPGQLDQGRAVRCVRM